MHFQNWVLRERLCSALMTKTRAVFLDRDGTLMEEVEYCRDAEKVSLLEGVLSGLHKLRAAGFLNIIVTNQSGIGRGWIALEEYEAVQARLLELVGPQVITATYFCPDAPPTASSRRKPQPGMLLEAARDHQLDLRQCWLIGDKASDIQSAVAAGVRPILVQTGYGQAENPQGADCVAKDFASAVEFILKQSDAS